MRRSQCTNTRGRDALDWTRGVGEPLFFGVLDHVADLSRLVQHGRDRAVFVFGQLYGIFNRLVRHPSCNTINQPDLGVDRRRSGCPVRLGPYLKTYKGLALLSQDAGNIITRACAQADQHQLHRTARTFTIAVDDNAVTTAGLPQKAMVIGPDHFRFNHAQSPFSDDYPSAVPGESARETIRVLPV